MPLRVRIPIVAFSVAAAAALPAFAQGPTVPAGTSISVRLLDSVVGSKAARGKRVRALVIAPVAAAGRAALVAGDTVAGVVRDAGEEIRGGRRHYVDLAFDQLVTAGPSSETAALHARVADIPDARETVDSTGRILGPVEPGFVRSREDWAAALLGVTDPLAGAIFLTAFRAEGLERHRRIAYAPGVEMSIRLTDALTRQSWPQAAAVPRAPAAVLTRLADAPPRATTLSGIPADVFTLALVGAEADVTAAFLAAGWTTPAQSSMRADVETLADAARARGFDAQPVSTLALDGRPPALAFEKVVNSMAKRHHLRIWPWGGDVDGRALWLVAATRDDGVLFSRARHSFTHRVDPAIDVEREKIVNDLLTAGAVVGRSELFRTPPAAPVLVNDGTTPVSTDWRLTVLVLRAGASAAPGGR